MIRLLTRPTPAQRVRAGAQRLDVVAPGWWWQVTAPVDLAHSTHCLLGQVFGHWSAGVRAVGLWEHRDLWAHGFHPTIPGTRSVRGRVALERAWAAEVAARARVAAEVA